MIVEREFAAVCEQLLADGGVELGRMLHATGLKTAGKFFAFTTAGDLVVKLPSKRVRELIASGRGRPCEPRTGSPMREWVCLRPADQEACAAYVLEARGFVATHGAATTRRPSRPTTPRDIV